MTPTPQTINPALFKVPYDVERDFAPVSMVASLPQIIAVYPGVPINTLKDLIAAAAAKPAQLSYASVGNGSPSHIAGELLKLKTGIDIVHVPYTGGGPAVAATLGGQVPILFVSIPPAMPHVRAARLRALAVTTLKRSPAAPNVPTVSEALGIADYEVDSWYAVFAPAKTPRAMIERMRQEIVKVVQTSEMKEKLLQAGRRRSRWNTRRTRSHRQSGAHQMARARAPRRIPGRQRVGAGFVNEINSRRPVDTECCSNPLRLDAHPFCEPLVLHRHDACRSTYLRAKVYSASSGMRMWRGARPPRPGCQS